MVEFESEEEKDKFETAFLEKMKKVSSSFKARKQRIKRNFWYISKEIAKGYSDNAIRDIKENSFDADNLETLYQYNLTSKYAISIANNITLLETDLKIKTDEDEVSDSLNGFLQKQFYSKNLNIDEVQYNAYFDLVVSGFGIKHLKNKTNKENKTQYIEIEHISSSKVEFPSEYLEGSCELDYFFIDRGSFGEAYFIFEGVVFHVITKAGVIQEYFIKKNSVTKKYMTKIPINIMKGRRIISTYSDIEFIDYVGYVDDALPIQLSLDRDYRDLEEYNNKQPKGTWIAGTGTIKDRDSYKKNSKYFGDVLYYDSIGEEGEANAKPEYIPPIPPPESLLNSIAQKETAIRDLAGSDNLDSIIQAGTQQLSGLAVEKLIQEANKQNANFINSYKVSNLYMIKQVLELASVLYSSETYKLDAVVSVSDILITMQPPEEIRNNIDFQKLITIKTTFQTDIQNNPEIQKKLLKLTLKASGIAEAEDILEEDSTPSDIETMKAQIQELQAFIQNQAQNPAQPVEDTEKEDLKASIADLTEKLLRAEERASKAEIALKERDLDKTIDIDKINIEERKLNLKEAEVSANIEHTEAKTTDTKIETAKKVAE